MSQYACEREGGYLAEPKTLEQMEFLAGIAALEESFYGIKFWWIGLEDIGWEGVWTWQHSRQEVSQFFWSILFLEYSSNLSVSVPIGLKNCVIWPK